jgi:hypothetical protein
MDRDISRLRSPESNEESASRFRLDGWQRRMRHGSQASAVIGGSRYLRVRHQKAMELVRDTIPTSLSSSTLGSLRFRQSTYWDVEVVEPTCAATRVHFVGKCEFRYVSPSFSNASLSQDHPILADYNQPFRQLFMSESPLRPELFVQQLSELVRTWSQEWRSFERYANPECDPLKVVRDGCGLLMSAPGTLVEAAGRLLSTHGARFTSLPGHTPNRQFQVLCFGRNFVVARHFDFEPIYEDGSGVKLQPVPRGRDA